MRDEEKQIEEMAKCIVDREKNYVCGETTCKICNLKKCDLHCSMYSDITYDCFSLYEAGYRKQSDTAKEIIEMLKAAKAVVKVHFEAYDELIKNIITQYGVELFGDSEQEEDEE